MGSHVIILNSIKAAQDLLDRRTTIYSDRYDQIRWSYDRAARLYHVLIQYTLQTPYGFVAETVCLIDVFVASVLTYPLRLNMDFNIAFMPYGPTWRHLRREFHINFILTEMEVSRPFEQRAVHRLLRNFLSSPNDFSKHLRQ